MNSIFKYFLVLLFSVGLNASSKLENVTLQLKWKYQFQFAGFIMAKEKGFYKDVGIDIKLKEFDLNTNIIEDVLLGKTDFAISDSSLVYEALKGKELLAMMAIYQDTPLTLIGLKSSNIKTLNDLNNKKIAFYEKKDGISIKTMLETNNINYIAKPPAFGLEKLKTGKIDMMMAYISNEPYIFKSEGLEIISFSPIDYGFEDYGDILFTSNKILNDNPNLVKNMYRASYKGWEYAFENLDETINLIHKKYNTLNKSYEALKYEAEILKKLSDFDNDFGKLDESKVKAIAQQFNKLKEEKNKLKNLDEFIYDFSKENKNTKSVNVLLGFDKPPFIFGKTSLLLH